MNSLHLNIFAIDDANVCRSAQFPRREYKIKFFLCTYIYFFLVNDDDRAWVVIARGFTSLKTYLSIAFREN